MVDAPVYAEALGMLVFCALVYLAGSFIKFEE